MSKAGHVYILDNRVRDTDEGRYCTQHSARSSGVTPAITRTLIRPNPLTFTRRGSLRGREGLEHRGQVQRHHRARVTSAPLSFAYLALYVPH